MAAHLNKYNLILLHTIVSFLTYKGGGNSDATSK